MNEHALFHRQESEYAYASTDKSLHIMLRTAKNEVFDYVNIIYGMKYTFPVAHRAEAMLKAHSDKLFDYYVFDVTLADTRFAYIFTLKQGDKVWYYSEDGLTKDYDFEHAYYTFFQVAYINSADVMHVVDWTKNAVFYQIFIDRFCRGDTLKDGSYINCDWDKVPEAKSFMGGDLKGITSKLDYLHDLGINALYLTPVFLSPSNHKYNIRDYLQVDPQFGTNNDLIELTDGAHTRGMHVVLDAVFNHCDCSHKLFSDVLQKGKKSEYYDFFIIHGDKPNPKAVNYECFADCGYMPKWNTSNPAVQKYLISIAVSYLTEYGLDGLRLDVSDEVSRDMWQALRRAVKAIKPDALILGEVWHANEQYLTGDRFDGVMNYKLQKILLDYFAAGRISAKEASENLNGLWVANTAQANNMMLNFLDNHDTPRFLRYAGGNKDSVIAALAIIVIFPGMPCIFYGTELPLDGGGDPDCRRTFDFSFKGQDQAYAHKVKKLLMLKQNSILQSGDVNITESGGLLILQRNGKNGRITAYFNRTLRTIKVPSGDKILFENNYDSLMLKTDGVLILEEQI